MDRSESEYGAFRFEVVKRLLAGWRASDIADLLEVERMRFPQISLNEINDYRRRAA